MSPAMAGSFFTTKPPRKATQESHPGKLIYVFLRNSKSASGVDIFKVKTLAQKIWALYILMDIAK